MKTPLLTSFLAALVALPLQSAPPALEQREGDFVARNFRFQTGLKFHMDSRDRRSSGLALKQF